MKWLLAASCALLLTACGTTVAALPPPPADCGWGLATLDQDIALDTAAITRYPDQTLYYTDVVKTWTADREYVRQACGQHPTGTVPLCAKVATDFAWARDVHLSYASDPQYTKDWPWHHAWADNYQRLIDLVNC